MEFHLSADPSLIDSTHTDSCTHVSIAEAGTFQLVMLATRTGTQRLDFETTEEMGNRVFWGGLL